MRILELSSTNVTSDAMKVIYICRSYSRDPEASLSHVCVIARELAMQGHLPIAPQIYLPRFVDEANERQLALDVCLRLVGLADEVWVYGDATEGMLLEIAEAERLGIPVVRKDLL